MFVLFVVFCVCLFCYYYFFLFFNEFLGWGFLVMVVFNYIFCKIICYLFMEVFLIIYKGFFGKIKLSKNLKWGM